MEDGLSSSYIVLEEDAEEQHTNRDEPKHMQQKETAQKDVCAHTPSHTTTQPAEKTQNTCKRTHTGTIAHNEEKQKSTQMTKKDRSLVLLTPVKKTKREVTSKTNTQSAIVHSTTQETKKKGYVSLVECFNKLEQLEKQERRQSIDRIVAKYTDTEIEHKQELSKQE